MPAFTSASDTSLAQKCLDQKLSREKEVLRRQIVNLLQRQKELELTVQELKCELQVCGNAKGMLLSSLPVCLAMLLSYAFSVVQFSCFLFPLCGIKLLITSCTWLPLPRTPVFLHILTCHCTDPPSAEDTMFVRFCAN